MGLRLEPLITPRPLAGRSRKICRKIRGALALALGARCRLGRDRGAP